MADPRGMGNCLTMFREAETRFQFVDTVYQANGNIQSRTGTGTYSYDATRPHVMGTGMSAVMNTIKE